MITYFISLSAETALAKKDLSVDSIIGTGATKKTSNISKANVLVLTEHDATRITRRNSTHVIYVIHPFKDTQIL